MASSWTNLAVAVVELPDSPKENVVGGEKAIVELRCPWADRYAVMQDILESQLQYPHDTNPSTNIRAVSGAIQPFEGSRTSLAGNDRLAYEEARLSVTFQSLTPVGIGFADSTISYSEALQPNVQTISMPHERFEWSDGSDLTNAEAPFFSQLGFDWLVTFYRYPANGVTDFLQNTGSVNSAAMSGIPSSSLLAGASIAAETMLYNGCAISGQVPFGGTPRVQLQSRWSFQPKGWNTYFRADSGQWERIFPLGEENAANFVRTYPLADHSSMYPWRVA